MKLIGYMSSDNIKIVGDVFVHKYDNSVFDALKRKINKLARRELMPRFKKNFVAVVEDSFGNRRAFWHRESGLLEGTSIEFLKDPTKRIININHPNAITGTEHKEWMVFDHVPKVYKPNTKD